MHRFCRGAGVASLRSLSDYRPERSFGLAYGLLVEETGELARAVLVLDAGGVVRHAEIVADLYDHPDYDAALAAVQGLLAG
jgi:thiol peroxidase